jgi:pseudouridine-5'-phosphate glycosidase
MNSHLKVSADVAAAQKRGQPVVALESTIIAHGMPFPENLAMAEKVEHIIRDQGATPATIAVIGGALQVGLAPAELERFASTGKDIMKVSTRDLPFVVARGLDGATTVASTMRIAAMAGIAVFATGGIGGAHRGVERTFDISADLPEFAESNVAVVTTGAKAILDLAVTLEILETLGVPVVGYGTDEFPAFYSRSSGHPLSLRCDQPEQVAALMRAKWGLGMKGGLVIANPIPAAFEIAADAIAPAITSAVAEAQSRGITGKKVTPFLLARLAEVTGGRSLRANIALVNHNARVAADIAVAYARAAS